MLASRFRLPGYLVPEVKKRGKFYPFASFALLLLKKPEEKFSRFAVILSLKFSKKAVVRNKVKRKILDSIRLLLPKIKPGFLVVFLPKKILIEKSFGEIQKEVEKAFTRLKLLDDIR